MKVRLSRDAQRHLRAFAAWWRHNRQKNPQLFRREFSRARALLATTPYSGSFYGTFAGREIHRLNLPRTLRHIYYFVDEERGAVHIVAIWGAATRDAPKLDEL